MDRFEEKAREMVRGIITPDAVMRYMSEADATRLITAALREIAVEYHRAGQEAMRERAAKAAEPYTDSDTFRHMEVELAGSIAASIRALPITDPT